MTMFNAVACLEMNQGLAQTMLRLLLKALEIVEKEGRAAFIFTSMNGKTDRVFSDRDVKIVASTDLYFQ